MLTGTPVMLLRYALIGLRVQIHFAEAGSKWLVLSFAKLQAL